MKNIKSQTPKTKKAPKTEHEGLYGGNRTNVDGGGLVLRDEPRSDVPVRHPFDLEERTAVFGENVVRLSRKIPRDPTNNRLIDQLVGASTSVGANFCEANDCYSRKDFRFTVKRCIKEAKEARFFLRMVAASEARLASEARPLYREATELIRILAAMYRKCNGQVSNLMLAVYLLFGF